MMKNVSIVIFFLISWITSSQEQDTILVRLQRDLAMASTDSLKVEALLELAGHQFGRDNYSAEDYLLNTINFIENGTYKSDHQLAIAYRVLGAVERRKGNYEKTYTYYYKALRLSSDSSHVAAVHHNLGTAKLFQKANSEALVELQKAIAIREAQGEYAKAALSYHEMGGILRRKNEMDSARFYYDKTLKLFAKGYKNDTLKYLNSYYRIQLSLGLIFLAEKKYDSALSKFKQARLHFSKPGGDRSRLVIASRRISDVYTSQAKFRESLFYLNEALSISYSEGLKHRIARGLRKRSELYKKMGDFEAALNDHVLYKKYSDSLNNAETIKKIQAQELGYVFEKEKLADSIQFAKENERILFMAKSQKDKKNLYLALLFVTILGGIGIILLLRKNNKNRARLSEEKLKKERVNKELLDQKLRINENETKRLIADNSMRLAFKQGLLDKIRKEIFTEEPEQIIGSLKSLTMELQSQIATESKLSEIQHKIDEVNRGFDTKLRELYPELTKTEREMCSLLRLNFSIKEIMTIRNTSMDSVKSIRYRIRKKMALSKGQELEQFVQNIE